MEITLLDGSSRTFQDGLSVYEIAKEISIGLSKKVMAGMVDGEVVDQRHKINKDCTLKFLTFDDQEGKKAFGILHLTLWGRPLNTFGRRRS